MELLEALTYIFGFDYISDLRFRTITPEQADAVAALPETGFTLDDFNRAARYICGVNEDYPDAAAAKQALSATLLRRPAVIPAADP